MWKLLLKRKRLKAKKFFNYEDRTLNVKAIRAEIPTERIPVNISLGEYNSRKIPKDISDKLKELDVIQYQIANAINSLDDGQNKENKKEEYINTLIEMLKSLSKDHSFSYDRTEKKKKILNSEGLNQFLKEANYSINNFSNEDLESQSTIIWPVALQDRPTIIHKAQSEIIKIMQTYGWKLKIIIGDCGSQDLNPEGIKRFKTELVNLLKKKGVTYDKISLLSEYFEPSADSGSILKNFTQIGLKLKYGKLVLFNTKQDTYATKDKEEIKERPTLKFIQPLLVWSVVMHKAEKLYKDHNKKTLIIAGQDELDQWRFIFNISSNIGGIFNSILEGKKNKTIMQEKNPMIFHSENEVKERINKGNFSRWLFDSFVTIPNFPDLPRNLDFCKKCDKNNKCADCIFPAKDSTNLPDFIDVDKFIKYVWSYIGTV